VAVIVALSTGCGASGGTDTANDPSTEASVSTTATAATGRPSSSATGPVDRDAYREALTATFVMDPDDEAMTRCIDEELTDAFDIDAIADSGVTPSEIADGGFLAGVDLSPDQASALATTIGDAMLECGSTRALVEYVLTSADDDATISDAGLDCAADAIAADLGASGVDAAIDPDADLFGDGGELLTLALSSCPEFAADAVAAGVEQSGREVTPEEHACLVEEFTEAGTAPRSDAETTAIAATCIDP
jgi:hypothetical protein